MKFMACLKSKTANELIEMFDKIFNHLKVDLKDRESFKTNEIPFRCNILTGENITVKISYQETVIDSNDIVKLLGHTFQDFSLNIKFDDKKHDKQHCHDVLFLAGVPFFVGAYSSDHKGKEYQLEYMINNPTVFNYNDSHDIDFDDKAVHFNLNVSGDTELYHEFKSMIEYLKIHFGL